MKKLFKIAFITVGVALTLNANAQKVGHIQLDSLLSVMPESKVAKQEAQDFYKKLESQVVAMQTELQTKYQDYQQNGGNDSPIIKQTKEKELNDLNQRIQDFQTNAQQEIAKKNEELSKPIYEKAKAAISQVAKDNGYKYVLDSSGGMILYSEPTEDLLPLVIKKLNITVTATPPAPKK